MKLATGTPIEIRARYKLVRTDSYTDIFPGCIINEADPDTGQAEVEIVVAGETKIEKIDMQPGGFTIVSARRGAV